MMRWIRTYRHGMKFVQSLGGRAWPWRVFYVWELAAQEVATEKEK